MNPIYEFFLANNPTRRTTTLQERTLYNFIPSPRRFNPHPRPLSFPRRGVPAGQGEV